ncbi:uncharacterized protein [Dysidea avara]|uniref:uncharacterized protein isoform X2 n=1 Tax=Dysidea avara TaxID=196820 RepID=UPI003321D7EE
MTLQGENILTTWQTTCILHSNNLDFSSQQHLGYELVKLINGRSLSSSRLRVVVNGDSATIMLDIDGPGSLECKLDDEEFQPCSPGDTFLDLPVGYHTITAVFTGPSTKLQSSVSFTIKAPPETTQPPSRSTASNLQVYVNGDSATILLDISGPGSLECSLDGGQFQPCSSGEMFTSLTAGLHYITALFIGESTGAIIHHIYYSTSTSTNPVTSNQTAINNT